MPAFSLVMAATVAGVLRLGFCDVVRSLVAVALFSLALPVSRLCLSIC